MRDDGRLYRARVLTTVATGVVVEIPALAANTGWGPIPAGVPGLTAGDTVLVGRIGASADDLAVLARVPGRWPDIVDIADLAATLSGLQDAITDLQADVTALQSSATALAAADTALSSRITELRHTHVSTGIVEVNTTSTTYVTLGSSDLSATLTYPSSGRLTVGLRMTGRTTLANIGATMAFEIRDTNSSGTQRVAPVDTSAVFELSDGTTYGPSLYGLFPVSGLPTSGTAYVRAMYRTDGGTAYFQFRAMDLFPSP